MGKPHILGSSADAPSIKFPEDFCLGPLINSTCDTPAGVSAVVYDSNPMVCMYISNTKVLPPPKKKKKKCTAHFAHFLGIHAI
jgi:hypothetical protein